MRRLVPSLRKEGKITLFPRPIGVRLSRCVKHCLWLLKHCLWLLNQCQVRSYRYIARMCGYKGSMYRLQCRYSLSSASSKNRREKARWCVCPSIPNFKIRSHFSEEQSDVAKNRCEIAGRSGERLRKSQIWTCPKLAATRNRSLRCLAVVDAAKRERKDVTTRSSSITQRTFTRRICPIW